jgi:hypothetical protein
MFADQLQFMMHLASLPWEIYDVKVLEPAVDMWLKCHPVHSCGDFWLAA